jgi:methylated-DNA-[protein]-cysteine S-methyltransferase
MAPIVYARQESAFGPLLLLARDGCLIGLYFADRAHAPGIGPAWQHEEKVPVFTQVRLELEEFASGHRTSFTVPYVLTGTPFQRQVWRDIAAIPFGETWSYGGLAARLGAFPRAVGTATGRNPISLIVPCHRVVGASGALTGYAGGLERKKRLLELEAATFATCHAIAA